MAGTKPGHDGKASCWELSKLGPLGQPSRPHTFAETVYRGLGAALAVRYIECVEADFDDAQGAENHRCVDVSHMGDPECLALQFADPDPEHHAAFLLAIALQRRRIVTASHDNGGDRVRPFAGFCDVKAEHLAFG